MNDWVAGPEIVWAFGMCQGTFIFPNPSIIYSSFPFITFHCTYLYYSSMTSTIISEHLRSSLSTALTSPLLSSILLPSIPPFTFLSSLLDGLYLSSFLSSFPRLLCLTLYIWGLSFHSHIAVGCPSAGLYPFLLESPARCTNYCSLNVPIN